MSERLRQSEEAAEQARQHRKAGQILEDRVGRGEATGTQAQAVLGSEDGRFGFGAFAAKVPTGEFRW